MGCGGIPANRTSASFIGNVEINKGGCDISRMEDAAGGAQYGAEQKQIKLHADTVASC